MKENKKIIKNRKGEIVEWTIEHCMIEAIIDIIIHTFFILLFFVLLDLFLILYLKWSYLFIFLTIPMVFFYFPKWKCHNYKKIAGARKFFDSEEKRTKIGKIDCWSWYNYILTSNCILVMNDDYNFIYFSEINRVTKELNNDKNICSLCLYYKKNKKIKLVFPIRGAEEEIKKIESHVDIIETVSNN